MSQLRAHLLIACAAVLGTACTSSEEEEAALRAQAAAIHDSTLTIDSHDDISFQFATDSVDPLNADRQVTLERMREGGLDVAFFIAYVGQTEKTPLNYVRARGDALTKFNAIHRMAEDLYPELIEIAYSADDVVRINNAGKLVAAIGIENGYVIGRDLALLADYHRRGARYITLAHNGHNDIADSAQARPQFGDAASDHNGISEFGADVIAEMNRLGIMVDISHISKQAALDAIRLSSAPVIASHSGVFALAAHPRNLDDETLLALRDNGGVVQTVAFDGFVKLQPPERDEARDALWEEFDINNNGEIRGLPPQTREAYNERWRGILAQWPGASVEEFVDHIDYAVDLIGIDHVGISSDFDGGGGIEGWAHAGETLNVTVELVRRGYTETEIEQLWSGNLLRVWRGTEAVAATSGN
jgi:membrane dipeptidase